MGHFPQTNLDKAGEIDENTPEIDIIFTFFSATVAWFAALPQCPVNRAAVERKYWLPTSFVPLSASNSL